jgi:hypothetical protein
LLTKKNISAPHPNFTWLEVETPEKEHVREKDQSLMESEPRKTGLNRFAYVSTSLKRPTAQNQQESKKPSHL